MNDLERVANRSGVEKGECRGRQSGECLRVKVFGTKEFVDGYDMNGRKAWLLVNAVDLDLGEGKMSFDRPDKHGPRQDEALKEQTRDLERSGRESHAQEWKEAEPAGEDQPQADLSPESGLVGGTAVGMDQRDVVERAELARWLQPSVFPATAERLVQSAGETHAPDRVIGMLKSLPAQESFDNVQDVWRALGGGTEDIDHRA